MPLRGLCVILNEPTEIRPILIAIFQREPHVIVYVVYKEIMHLMLLISFKQSNVPRDCLIKLLQTGIKDEIRGIDNDL